MIANPATANAGGPGLRGDGPHAPAESRAARLRRAWQAAGGGPLAVAALLLIAGLVPLPHGRLRALRQSAASLEPNRGDREVTAGSYYEGLIDGGPRDWRSELTRRLLGETPTWNRFQDIRAHYDLRGDYLGFALIPGLDREVLGSRFTTNTYGLRDRDHTVAKPPGVFRIVLLGSSIDMGWGVGTDETYENRLEDWLNHRAALTGLTRRFQVINLAVAAYGPLQRLEAFRRTGPSFEPDLVIYSATMLDPRLMEIHLTGLLRDRVDPPDDFVRRALDDAGISAADLALTRRKDEAPDLADKDGIKARLRPRLWGLIDAAVATLREECRRVGVPLAYQVIPRVGMADAPGLRDEPVAKHRAIAARNADWTLDLSATFDETDQARLEVAPWDDHPNARGHDLLFRALAHAIAREAGLYRAIFGADP